MKLLAGAAVCWFCVMVVASAAPAAPPAPPAPTAGTPVRVRVGAYLLLSLMLLPEKVTERLALATSALIATVLLHLNVTSAVPPVGYLTFADKFMVINYVALVLTIVAAVAMIRYHEHKQDARMLRLRTISVVTIPLVWAVLQGLNLLTL